MNATISAEALDEVAVVDQAGFPSVPVQSSTYQASPVISTDRSASGENADQERAIIGGLLSYGPEPFDRLGLSSDDFASPERGKIWSWLQAHRSQWVEGASNVAAHQVCLQLAGLIKQGGPKEDEVRELVDRASALGEAGSTSCAEDLLKASVVRQKRAAAEDFGKGLLSEQEFDRKQRALDKRLSGQRRESADKDLLAALDLRRVGLGEPPTKPDPLFLIGSNVVATAGNIVVIAAQAKAGKSAYLGAMIAAALNPKRHDGATLGVRSAGAEDKAIIHFDTEQSRYDHYRLIEIAVGRAGLETPPANLRSYCVTDFSNEERLAMLRLEMARAGSIFAVLLDGVADFVSDPNNPEEAFEFVGELHSLAIRYGCVIIAVLHENPSSGDFGKTRGHLGSQLERKAETNLKLQKDKTDEVTTVWTDRGARHCSIPKSSGTRFKYCHLEGCHVVVGSKQEDKAVNEMEELRAFAVSMFAGRSEGYLWSEAVAKIGELRGVKEGAARNYLKKLKENGVVELDAYSKYVLAG
jgi:hypothetical protein